MLFDLRGRGRRRTIQAIYVTLAILMGGGLVFFGIGGNTSGGLFDAFKSGGRGGGGGGGGRAAARRPGRRGAHADKSTPPRPRGPLRPAPPPPRRGGHPG